MQLFFIHERDLDGETNGKFWKSYILHSGFLILRQVQQLEHATKKKGQEHTWGKDDFSILENPRICHLATLLM